MKGRSVSSITIGIGIGAIIALSITFSIAWISAGNQKEITPIRFEFGSVIEFESKILDEKRDLFIILPDDYEKSGSNYPVLYALDGSPFKMASIYPSLSNRGTPEMIVVGIGNTDRNRDMFMHKIGEPRPTAGEADKFLKVLSTEIIPFIDANYRTSNYRAIYGQSAAGMFATLAFFEKPQLFSGCIASAPTLGYAYKKITTAVEKCYSGKNHNKRKVVFVHGENDLAVVTSYVEPFSKFLTEKAGDALEIEIRTFPNLGHFTSLSIPVGMKTLFDDYQLKGDLLLEEGEEGLKQHFAALQTKYGIQGVEADLSAGREFWNAANNFVFKKDFEGALAILATASKKYPDDSGLLFFEGLYLTVQGKEEAALKKFYEAINLNDDSTNVFICKVMVKIIRDGDYLP